MGDMQPVALALQVKTMFSMNHMCANHGGLHPCQGDQNCAMKWDQGSGGFLMPHVTCIT